MFCKIKYICLIVGLLNLYNCRIPIELIPKESYKPITADGWKIGLYRFPAYTDTVSRKYPIIIGHGISGNYNYYRTKNLKQSLVHALNKNGYDVWLLSFRAREGAKIASWFWGNNRYADYHLSHLAKYDLDLAISHVLEKTKKEKVIYAGHSMGGFIGFARLGAEKEKRIAQFISLAGLTTLGIAALHMTFFSTRLLKFVDTFLPYVPLGHLKGPGIIDKYLPFKFNLLNTPIKTLGSLINHTGPERARLFEYAISNDSMNLWKTFDTATYTGEIYDEHHTINYTKAAKHIQVPTLIVMPKLDGIILPEMIRYSYDQINSKDKTLFLVSKATGSTTDYGHLDHITGDNTHKDVYPTIIRWLNKRN